jgi:hypothetical protein
MSRRQRERASRFQVDIEREVRIAAAAFRDNDVETSITRVVRLWWTSRLRGRRFAELVRQAHDATQARISLGAVERGKPGRREAMPYFLAVVRDLVDQTRRSRTLIYAPRENSAGAWGVPPPSPGAPYPSALRGTRLSDPE